MMTGSTCRQMGRIPSWRQVYFFALSSALDFEKQAAFAALFAVLLLGFQQPGFAEIPQGAADGRGGQLEIGGDGWNRRPAFAVFVGPVGKIDIHRDRPMRQFHAV